jgi:hypothetical protein
MADVRCTETWSSNILTVVPGFRNQVPPYCVKSGRRIKSFGEWPSSAETIDGPNKTKSRKKSNLCKNNMMEDKRPALGCKPSAALLLWVNHWKVNLPIGAINVLHHDFDFDTDVAAVDHDLP